MYILSAVSTFLLLQTTVHAVTTVHYYKNPSCNTGTDIGSFDAPINDTVTDTTCHSINNTAKALYVNGLDDGCAVIAYKDDTTCTPSAAAPKLAMKGDCYFLDDLGVIGSWRSVCGTAVAQASSSLAAAAGGTASATSSGNGTASATTSPTALVSAKANSGGTVRGIGMVEAMLGSCVFAVVAALL